MTAFLHKHPNMELCPNQEDNALIETLTNVFKEKVPYSKRLKVAGILSYTTDGDSERFLKIDFSSSDPASTATDIGQLSPSTSLAEKSPTVLSPETTTLSSSTTNGLSDYSTVGSVSPPLLPPLIICNPKTSRPLAPESPLFDQETHNDSSEKLHDDSSEQHRRDRRKLRRPKRQILNPVTVVTKQEDGVENDHSFSSKKIKYAESDSGIASDSWEAKDLNQNIDQPMCAVTASAPASLSSTTEDEKSTSEPSSLPVSTPALQSLSSQSKLTINGKSISISELGDICNLLPLNTLLGRAMGANKESISGVDKINQAGIPPVLLTNSGAASQVGSATLLTANGSLATQLSGQSVLLNPNLAAALAAALSGVTGLSTGNSNNSQVSANFESNQPSCLSNITTPSIALTGPSGELLGTIPIASATNGPVAQPNTMAPQASNFNSMAHSTAVSLATNQCVNSSSLINTLNWLKHATTSTDANQQLVSSAMVSSPAGSTASLLQSLAQQQSQTIQSFPAMSQVPKSQPMASISIGPTLALIGTLGMNQHSSSSGTLTTHSTDTTCSVTPTSAVSYSTPHSINYGGNNTNNAALVAAAILRGLSNAKQSQCDTNESCTSDTTMANSQGSLTLITNNLTNTAHGRPGIISADVPIGSVSNLLSPKGFTGNLSMGTTTLTPEQSNTLLAAMLNRGSINVGNVNATNSRGSIMLSYPRVSGEMNVVLAPASTHSLNGQLTSMATLPAGISIQNLSTSHSTGFTLSSPVLLHPSTTSSTPQTTVVSATASSVASTAQRDSGVTGEKCSSVAQSTNDVRQQTNAPDPTSSAIDRILQTIKGCMNNSINAGRNRELEPKPRIQPALCKKTESPHLQISNSNSEGVGDQTSNLTSDGRTLSVKLTPITFSMNMSSSDTIVSDQDSIKQSEDNLKKSLLNNSRISLSNSSTATTDGAVTKVYRCRYCGKTFNRKFCRERHERLHTGVKPYTCEICDEKFIRLEDKKRHVRSLQHYLTGRSAYLNSEIPLLPKEDMNEENTTCLPIIGRPIQTEAQEGVDEAFNELEVHTGIDTSESTSNDHGSECGSFDIEESPEKTEYGSYNNTDYISGVVDSKSSLLEGDDDERANESPTTLSSVMLSMTKPTTRCRIVLRETQSEINSASSPSQNNTTKFTPAVPGEPLCIQKVTSS